MKMSLLILLGVLLASCGPSRLLVRLETTDPTLKSVMAESVKTFQSSHPLGLPVEVAELGSALPEKDTAMVHLSFRSVPPTLGTSPHLILFPADFAAKNGVSLMVPLANWAKEPRGRWQALPLMWDVWGATNTHLTQPIDWEATKTSAAFGGKLLVAGNSPLGRQALFSVSLITAGKASLLLALERGELSFKDPSILSAYPDFLTWPQNRLLYPNSMRFEQTDLENLSGSPLGGELILAQTYHSASLRATTQGMKPFHFGNSQQDYTLIGSVVAGYYTGPETSSARAFEFLAYLATPEVQKVWADRTQMLPANLATPRRNPLHAELETDALRASQWISVNPDPVGEPRVKTLDDTLKFMLGNPTRWEAQLPVEKSAE